MNLSPRPRGGGHAAAWSAIRRAILGALLVTALAPSCRSVPIDGFELDVPAAVASKTAWYEVGVFPGPGCTALAPQLTGGIPAAGYVQRLAFRSSAAPPGITDLPRAKYAIGVAGRAADCSVVATGCSDVDLTEASSVTVVLNAVGTPARPPCASAALLVTDRPIPVPAARCSEPLPR